MICPHRLLTTILIFLATQITSGADAPTNAKAPTIVGAEQSKAVQASLAGEWSCRIGQSERRLRLTEDGQFEIGEKTGSYHVTGNALTLQTEDGPVTYQFTLSAKELTLLGGDLAEQLKFTRVTRFGAARDWRATWSWPSLKAKARRIVTIVLIVLVCLAAVRLVRMLMQLIIYSEWGPLRFVYRRHKKRTMTIYSLVLNISKYAVYLLAIGFVLTELGVNYTMYFASLSVVGLAIGFGSQGLVQDMVTGFFIIFEEQFNVGDMVEIPPHTGIVEELGLRMTRLRNYQGQRVTIPNRNIAVVGNYVRGAQQVFLDVAVTSEGDVGKATRVLRETGKEIAGQFQDIILSPPESPGEIALSTGERFIRLSLTIWPQQQWVIDQEMTPRLRAAMKTAGVEIPGEKIVVFYHPRESRSVSRSGRV